MMMQRRLVNRLAGAIAACALGLGAITPAQAEDGYSLWLRHAPLDGSARVALERFDPASADLNIADPTLAIAASELDRAFAGMLGHAPDGDGSVDFDCASQPAELDRFTVTGSAGRIAVSGNSPVACLYATYALIRAIATGSDPASLRIDETAALPLRMLNHWDDADGRVERGYAGRSIFDWWHLPEDLNGRMIDYARANASIGINAVALNNVNADPVFLTPRYIAKVARLADAFRPYGIRVYLSPRFSAPRDLGGLETADPLDPRVRRWWDDKADEIYRAVPDFGGFLVKANAEGQPGPQDYGRSHADGANMLAAALGTRGTVIWRAFVYQPGASSDRAREAFAEFAPLDGKFAANVILQVKNGPLDFQPREPFHPLFGAMPRTRLMLEVQPTREYLGQAKGIAYLAPMWREVLDADTGPGGQVVETIREGGMAGVANIGADRNWTGTDFDQANWYAFGRLAWNPSLSSEAIAREWAAQTFTSDPRFVDGVVPMMLASRQAAVDFMAPLGLAHLMGTGHHYGPAPWVCDLDRPEWNPCYYHRADKAGIGFDRTAAGSAALADYAPAVAARWSDPKSMDEDYLLWFHHLPWDFETASGRTLWAELAARYDRGVSTREAEAVTWRTLAASIDRERATAIAARLESGIAEARWWRDASLAYWQSINGLALPTSSPAPAHPLAHYQSLEFLEAPGQ